jgi:ribosome biogenesis GTPase / thiamine phosphate phosphatase
VASELPLDLSALGWSAAWQGDLERDLEAARVIAVHRGEVDLYTAAGVVRTRSPGGPGLAAMDVAVGDWVGLADGAVRSVLTRRTALVRGATRRSTAPQTLAANVDVAFVVSSLGTELDLEWIERCLVAVWESGARPEIVLTKADRIDDPLPPVEEVEAVAPGVPVHVVSALSGAGCERLRRRIEPGATAVLLGPSGVGKSTLVNRLAGRELMATSQTGAGDRGRHTTSLRQLILLPGGGAIIDMPGLRELRLFESTGGFDKAFVDVEALSGECRFSDCAHENEPGCAVIAAVNAGALRPERVRSWQKFDRELRASALSA